MESLFENEFSKKEKKILKFVQDVLKHGHRYETDARRKYYEIMQYKMKWNIFLKEAELVIQPLLFWFGASPDGLIYNKENSDHPGLLETNALSTEDILFQQNYIQELFRMIIHKFRQLLDYCKLIIVILFTFKCMIITRVEFDNKCFENLILKFNEFYKNFMLPGILLRRQIKMMTLTWMLEVVSLLR